MNKLYTKTIDGKTVVKSNIVVIKDGRQYINPSEAMILEDGWVEYSGTPSADVELEVAKTNKINEVLLYELQGLHTEVDTMKENGVKPIVIFNSSDLQSPEDANNLTTYTNIIPRAITDALGGSLPEAWGDDVEGFAQDYVRSKYECINDMSEYNHSISKQHIDAIKKSSSASDVDKYNYKKGYVFEYEDFKPVDSVGPVEIDVEMPWWSNI